MPENGLVSAAADINYATNATQLRRSNEVGLIRTLKHIRRHPLGGGAGLARYAKWQVGTRILGSPTVVLPWVDDTMLIAERGMRSAAENLYCGLHEYADMSFLLDLLQSGDLFVDVGANIGSYTVLASGVCGAKTIALEPGSEAFRRLEDHIGINKIDALVEPHRIGVSDREGRADFTSGLDTANRIADSRTENAVGLVRIPVDELDNILGGRVPTAIKIDVEGWEAPVLAGAHRSLDGEDLLACIIAVNDSTNQYGFWTQEIFEVMESHDFSPYSYSPRTRSLTSGANPASNNVLFIRDLAAVKQRVERAPRRALFGHMSYL